MSQMDPTLVAQLVDPGNASLSAGSNTEVAWRCSVDERHVWRSSPNTRKRSPGCPICQNKIVLRGVNDLWTTDRELAEQLVDREVGYRVHAGAHTQVRWACTENLAWQWETSVVSRARGAGCPFCSGRLPKPGLTDLRTTHSDLADTLVDPDLAVTVGAGSAKELQWRCPDCAHEWPAPVRNRTGVGRKKPTGCPKCAGRSGRDYQRRATLGETGSPLLDEAVDRELAAGLSLGSGIEILWRCDECGGGHEYSMGVRHRMRGQGCPVKAGVMVMAGVNDLATTHPELAAQLVDPSLAQRLSRGSERPVDWRCAKGHEWSASTATRRAGNGCPICAGKKVLVGFNDLATTHPGLAAQLVEPSIGRTITAGNNAEQSWRCPVDATHTWEAMTISRTRGNGCPICAGKKVLPGFNDLATLRPELARELVDPQLATTMTVFSAQRVDWQCTDNPDHVWNTHVYQRTLTATGCPICQISGPERALTQIVKALVGQENVLTSQRGLLGGQRELDIVVPSRGVAIEFNGVYWHAEHSGKPASYHRDKSEAAVEAGLQLIHVWDDDWRTRPAVVIRALSHKLGSNDRLLEVLPDADPRIAERLHARRLTCDETDGGTASQFLVDHHIQGAVALTRAFVLRDGTGEIRALLGLRSPRGNARMKRAPGEWEIQRYATFGSVRGGFTKLLAYAQKALQAEGEILTRWVSFSADDISGGGLYASAGFTAVARIRHDYKYVGAATGGKRSPKEAFQRKRFRDDPNLLWDESWTERQAAAANGLHRVYDAGKTRWEKDVA